MAKYRVNQAKVRIDARHSPEFIPGDGVQDIKNLHGRYRGALVKRPGRKRWNSTEIGAGRYRLFHYDASAPLWEDKTPNNDAGNNFRILGQPWVDSAFYIGAPTVFNGASFTISSTYSAGVDTDLVWEYWDGSAWATMTLDTATDFDNLDDFAPGDYTITFPLPPGWQTTTVSVSASIEATLYWIRVRMTTVTTWQPGSLNGNSFVINTIPFGIQGQYRFARADGNKFNLLVTGKTLFIDNDSSGTYKTLVKFDDSVAYIASDSSNAYVLGEEQPLGPDNPDNGSGGVFLKGDISAGTYSEYTGDFSKSTGTTRDIVDADSGGSTDLVYIGHQYKFNAVAITIDQDHSESDTVTWQYYNGSAWTNLTMGLNEISTLQPGTGKKYVIFEIPSDWTTIVANTWAARYWIRFGVVTSTGGGDALQASKCRIFLTSEKEDLSHFVSEGDIFEIYDTAGNDYQSSPISTVSNRKLTLDVTLSGTWTTPVRYVIREDDALSIGGATPKFTVMNNRCIVSDIDTKPKVTDGHYIRNLGYTKPDPDTMSIAVTSGGRLSGRYKWAVTYLYKTSLTEGGESNPVYSDEEVLDDEYAVITLPTDFDQWVEGFRVYRTKDLNDSANSPSVLYQVRELLGTAHLTWDDNIKDTELSGVLLETDHDEPPDDLYVTEEWLGKLYAIKRFDHKLYYSESNDPNIFKPANFEYIGLGDEGTGLTKYFGPLIYFTKRNRYTILYNPSLSALSWREAKDGIGCIAPLTLVESPLGLIFLAYDDVYLWDGVNQPQPIGSDIERVLRGEDNGTGVKANRGLLEQAAGAYYRDVYYLTFTGAESSINNAEFICEIHNGFRWFRNDRGWGCYLRMHHGRQDNDVLLAGAADSVYVFQIEGPGLLSEDDDTTDAGTANYTGPSRSDIEVSIKSKQHNLGVESQFRSLSIRTDSRDGDITIDVSTDFDQATETLTINDWRDDWEQFVLGTSVLGADRIDNPKRGLKPEYIVNPNEEITGQFFETIYTHSSRKPFAIVDQSFNLNPLVEVEEQAVEE